MIAPPAARPVWREMSDDRRFRGRLRRLIAISAVMLGSITLLAVTSADPSALVVAMLAAGWVLMPTLLYAGLDRPSVRYLLVVPATLVTAGLVSVALHGPLESAVGWWVITAGVLFGGGLGAWFWYRWMPVPDQFDDPFSSGRIALIAIHVALIVVGIFLVIAA